MEKKFTKGKWISLGTRVGVDVADGISSICEMSTWMSGKDVIYNSQLIAAAPDLLEALESFVYEIEKTRSDDNIFEESYHLAKEAIKKATE